MMQKYFNWVFFQILQICALYRSDLVTYDIPDISGHDITFQAEPSCRAVLIRDLQYIDKEYQKLPLKTKIKNPTKSSGIYT